MNLTKLTRLLVAALAAFPLLAAVADEPLANWIDSPEAYFLTTAERSEWLAFETNAQKEAFRERYWSRRDPTPTTPRNEFKEVVQARIAAADKSFALQGIRG